MTKLNFNFSKKSSDNDSEKKGEIDETDNLHRVQLTDDQQQATDPANVTPIILVGEMDLSTGKCQDFPSDGSTAQKPYNGDIWGGTFNWKALKRVAITQMALSMIAMICILISIMTAGMNSYKFSQFIMATYLLVTGHGGLRGSAKSYKHLIFYLIMSALQWMINIMVLGCLTYAMYDGPYVNYNVRQTMRSIDFDDYGTGIALLTAEIIGSLSMMGTIITGMLGLTHCCRGFGNLLMNQEKFFQMNRNMEIV